MNKAKIITALFLFLAFTSLAVADDTESIITVNVDSGNAPVEGTTVDLYKKNSGEWEHIKNTDLDSTGTHEFEVDVTAVTGRNSTFKAVASKKCYTTSQEKQVSLASQGDDATINLNIEARGKVTVETYDGAGDRNPLSGVGLELYKVKSEGVQEKVREGETQNGQKVFTELACDTVGGYILKANYEPSGLDQVLKQKKQFPITKNNLEKNKEFHFDIPEASATLNVKALDNQDNTVGNAQVELMNSNGNIINETLTSSNGVSSFDLHPGKNYKVNVSKSGYTEVQKTVDSLQNGETTQRVFTLSPAAIRPSFNWNPQNPDEDTRVSFSSTSEADSGIRNQHWEFGSPQNDANGESTSYVFEDPGVYPVKLEVTDNNGETASTTNYINVGDVTQCAIRWEDAVRVNDTSITEGGSVSAHLSVYNRGTKSQSVEVIFKTESGHSVGSQSANIEAGSSNEFSADIVLDRSADIVAEVNTVSSTCDSSGTASAADVDVEQIDDQAPTAKFTTSEFNPEVDEPITFTAQKSDDISSYKWDLDGDVNNTIEQEGREITHSYSSSGQKNITLIVTDEAGNSDNITRMINVIDTNLDIGFRASNVQPETNEAVRFTAEGGQEISRYEWDFNDDGNTDATGRTASYSFTSTGEKKVKLTVKDVHGNSNTGFGTVNVIRGGPTASFSVTDTTPKTGDTVTFTAQWSDEIQDYSWDLDGDGNTDASGRTVSHTYSNTGRKSVTLTITDVYGETDTASQSLNVLNGGPRADFSVSNVNPDVGETVRVQANWGRSIQDYSWDFDGDGNTEGTGRTSSYTYDSSGFKNITLTVTDTAGKTDTGTRTIAVNNQGPGVPTAEITVTPESPAVDDTVTLSATSSSDQDGTIDDYSWNFGDGSNQSSGSVVTHSYSSPGTYYPRLTVEDNDGNTNFAVKPVRITGLGTECNVDVGNLDVGPTLLDPSKANLGIKVESVDSGDLRVKVKFFKEGQQVYSNERTVEDEGEMKFETTVHSNTDAEMRAEVTVTGDCGTETFNRTQLFDANEDKINHPGKGLEIVEVNHPQSICSGGTFSANLRVRNGRDKQEKTAIMGRGLGTIFRGQSFKLDSGEVVTQSVTFSNVEGKGNRSFTVSLANGGASTQFIKLRDCGINGGGTSGITSMDVNPSKIAIGGTVTVSGQLKKNGRRNVVIRMDGEEVTTVSSRPDGYYEAHVQTQKAGMVQISASTGSDLESKTISVLPTVDLAHLEAPRKVQVGESFEICGEVESQVSPRIRLRRNGEAVKSMTKAGSFCFKQSESEPGTYNYKVEAGALGAFDSATTTVQVMETGAEVSNFPDQIASVKSDSGMVKVDLYNTADKTKTYNLEMKNVPRGWISDSEKQVVLPPNRRKTVYFYFTPKEKGQFTAELNVESEGESIYERQISLTSRRPKVSSPLIVRLIKLVSF